MEQNKIREEEINFLISESKKHPELFENKTFIDSPDFLEKIGIFFGNEKVFPKGYLKLWPSDFIVEEKSMEGIQETVDIEDFFDKEKGFFEKDPMFYATMVKCKLPTFEATKDLAKKLEIDSKNIKYAGIKDTDAITAQLISIRGADIEKIKKVSSPYYFLKNIYSAKGIIEIGSLEGNRFTILVRTGPDFDKDQFNHNLEKIKNSGFYNFFYTQRFSSPRFINWFWGLLILKGEYRKSVMSFLCSEGQREISYFKNIRNKIKDNFDNWDKVMEIIKPFPLALRNEIKVVKHLQQNPNDFVGALKQLPEQTKLWVFAYESLLFNRKISEYIENRRSLPEKLPMILSKNKEEWMPYFDFLKEDGISGINLKNIMPFPDILWKKKYINTKEKVDIHKVAFTKEGVVLSFSLPKGCYATTFLAHLFQLTTGVPPKDISNDIVDTKEILNEKPAKDLIEKFKEITFSKSENILGVEQN